MATTLRYRYREIFEKPEGVNLLIGAFMVAAAFGLGAAYIMETAGHQITGMTNRVVWGTPHVFAVFLIVAASGALNAASMASVFGQTLYKPLARFSGVLAISLLVGGLSVLVLDLGRPDRLIIAMTNFNFKSIFAWNIFLYTGFMLIVAVYLWMMMEPRMNRYSKPVGVFAFLWRLVLTTGTGSIFGFLVARQAYDAAVMAPLFVAMSFAIGLAVFILVLFPVLKMTGRPIGPAIVSRLGRLLGVFVAGSLYFVIVQHLTNLYAPEHTGIERFILSEGGIYTALFWGGQIVLGSLVPLGVLFYPGASRCRFLVMIAAALVVAGGLAQIYVIIIGGQAFPLVMFPGMEVTSSFFDGGIAPYAPSLPEVTLGIGGVAIALGLTLAAIKVLPVLPMSLADAVIDPHYTPPPEPEPEPEPEEKPEEDEKVESAPKDGDDASADDNGEGPPGDDNGDDNGDDDAADEQSGGDEADKPA